jgi:hypothetical protein
MRGLFASNVKSTLLGQTAANGIELNIYPTALERIGINDDEETRKAGIRDPAVERRKFR